MVLEILLKPLAEAVVNPYSFWMLSLIVGSFIFVVMKVIDIPKMYAGITAFMVATLGLEFGLKALFQKFSIPIDFGYYVIKVPVYGETIIREGVMSLRFLDFVFNFGIFRNIGLAYLNAITPDKLTGMELPAWFRVFVAIYVSVDSVLVYMFMVALLGAIISFISRHLNINRDSITLYIYSLAAIPVIAFNYYISNPFYEYKIALPQLQKVLYLATSGETTTQILFFGSLALSIGMVMEIIAMVYHYILQAGQTTLKPGWQITQWSMNAQGVGFIYTMSFAVMYALHNFEWYVFFPVLILYMAFRSIAESVISSQQKFDEREELRGMIKDAVKQPNQPTGTYQHQSGSSNWLIVGVAIVLALVVGWQMNLF